MEVEEAGSPNVGNHLQIDIASYPRRLEISWTPLWEAQVSYCADVL
jgi:hypothetical protein